MLVPLPTVLSNVGFTPDAANETFTTTVAGTYLITYSVSLDATALVSAGILVNGVLATGSVSTHSAAADTYSATFIASLAAGSEISLALFDDGTSVTLADDNGASLTILRLS